MQLNPVCAFILYGVGAMTRKAA